MAVSLFFLLAGPRPRSLALGGFAPGAGRRRLDLLRLLDHPGDHPALAAAHRPRFDDGDAVADLDVAVLVVREKLRGAALCLAVELVPRLPLDGDGDRLLHLVADDNAGDFCL